MANEREREREKGNEGENGWYELFAFQVIHSKKRLDECKLSQC